ncbi:GAP family protein [Natronoglycomyces albus]|uniref:GAP family protein n=1 Tax=Natronoglycomyces albus TaxID=2811108 RepID=A0A895XVP1_9ACTN|nr:GAP family protein [Natronoglycomyces albus]QSB06290.1 GAP family protein [Natronoglycomyces albus]
MTWEIGLTVAGLGLLDALSPAIVGVTIYLLLNARSRLATLLFTYVATVVVCYFAFGVALKLGLGALLPALENLVDSPVGLWAQAILGGILLVIAIAIPGKKKRQKRQADRRLAAEAAEAADAPGSTQAAASPPHKGGTGTTRVPKSLTVSAMISFGLITVLIEGFMVLPYFAAIGIMTAAEVPVAAWLPLILMYNLIMVSSAFILYGLWKLFGQRLQPRLERWRDKLAAETIETMAWILGIAGFLVARGAVIELHALGLLPF